MPRVSLAWRAVRTLVRCLALMVVGVALLARPADTSGATAPLLRLHRGVFDAQGGAPLAAAGELGAAVPDTAIIQFSGPVGAADRAALVATGVTIAEYLPDYAYLVRGDAGQLVAAAGLPNVYARADLIAADKLAPALLRGLLANAIDRPTDVRLYAWPGRDAELQVGLARAGIDPARPLSAAQIRALTALPALRWAEPAFVPRIFNDRARAIMHVDAAWERHGLYGAGQVVAIADTGLDTGDLAAISPDFAGRVVAGHVLAQGGTLADEIGHGTHVAGSLAGAGVQSGADPAGQAYAGSFAGVAPAAGLVIQAFETDQNGTVSGLGNDSFPIFAQAYADGARIHSDSWGGPTGIPFIDPEGYFGGYTTPSRRADEFVWQHPDMAIFVAAGNSGNDGDYYLAGCLPNGDGRIDEDSLNAPGTAKNVITLGASESLRLDGNLSTLTWSDFDPSCYRREPLASDLLSNNPDGMAAFSSRGPTDDGRIKPDLVAPGTSIVSNRSSHPDSLPLWGIYTPNPAYTVAGGTSMATPLAAGAGALVREWLGRQGLTDPSAAAVKALLIGTAANMAPGQYGAGSAQEIPASRPNGVTGWGRVDLGFLDAPAPFDLWLDDNRQGLATGQTVAYAGSADRPLTVSDSGQPLRVTLAWSDPPASLTAARQLVNDLDLVVIGPDGQQHWGNAAGGGDRHNNVEGVILGAPPVGSYRVEVRAHNIPIASQPFALVVGGPIGAGPVGPAPLALVANSGLSVDEGGAAQIGRDRLEVAGRAPAQIRYTLTGEPSHGALRLEQQDLAGGASFTQADIDAGRVDYRHDGGETTADAFRALVEGGSGPDLQVLFSISIAPLNDAPVALDDTAWAAAGGSTTIRVLDNDQDAEGDPLTVSAVAAPAIGQVVGDGPVLTYTAPPGFTGIVTFTYSVRDPAGAAATGTVRVAVERRLWLPLLWR